MTDCVVEVIVPALPLIVETVVPEAPIEVELGIPGPPGPQGPQGVAGAPGLPGLSGANYVHTQGVPSADWTITHGLGRYPSVTVVDSAGTTVYGNVDYLSTNQITIHFTAAFGGAAYLN